jgi:hypothetical protein
MTRDDAYLIFHKMRADRALVFCTGQLWGWTIAIVGKVVSVTRDEVILVSIDRRSGSISLRLDMEDLLIRYADAREIPMLQESGERDSTLASLRIALPLRMRPADLRDHPLEAPPREVLFFLELPREEKQDW